MCIVTEDYGLETSTRGTRKRELSLTDKSKVNIIATLWGSEVENFQCDRFSVIIIRKGKISEYQGRKKINCNIGTLVWVVIMWNYIKSFANFTISSVILKLVLHKNWHNGSMEKFKIVLNKIFLFV